MPAEKLPALYLYLQHGRPTADTDMNTEGYDGPVFGPLLAVRTIYGTHLRIEAEHATAELVMAASGDLVWFEGHCYGEWVVTSEAPGLDRRLVSAAELMREQVPCHGR